MKDYAKLLPESATPQMRARANEILDNLTFLIFKSWYQTDPMTGIKEKMAEVHCTRTDRKFYLPITERQARYGGFGIYLPGENKARFTMDGKNAFCPCCGRKAGIVHTSTIGQWGTVWQTFSVGQYEILADGSPAFVTFLVQRRLFKNGTEEVALGRSAAYVCAPEGVLYYKGRMKYFYSDLFFGEWEQGGKTAPDYVGAMEKRQIVPVRDAEFVGTALENAKIERYLADSPEEYSFPVTYLKTYKQHPNVECLVTSGLTPVFNKLVAFGGNRHEGIPKVPQEIDWRKKRPFEMMRQKARSDLGNLMLMDGEKLSLTLLSTKAGIDAKVTEWRKEYSYEMIVRMLKKKEDPSRVLAYFKHQNNKYVGYETLEDYWRMAKQEGVPLKTREDRFPADLRRAHDQVTQLMNQRLDREKAEKAKAKAGKFEALAEKYAVYRWTQDGLTIKIAETPMELIQEGRALNHCVASYIDTHAKGERCIFVIRKAEAPDEPYYTLELDLKTLKHIQNRGKRNCAETPEVIAFRDKWLEHIREIENAAQKPQRKESAA